MLLGDEVLSQAGVGRDETEEADPPSPRRRSCPVLGRPRLPGRCYGAGRPMESSPVLRSLDARPPSSSLARRSSSCGLSSRSSAGFKGGRVNATDVGLRRNRHGPNAFPEHVPELLELLAREGRQHPRKRFNGELP